MRALLVRGGTVLGVLCLVAAAVLWSMVHLDRGPAGPGATAGEDPPREPVPPALLGTCVRGVCLEPADAGIRAATDFDTWRLTPSSMDVLEQTVHGRYTATLIRNTTEALLGVIDTETGQWVFMEQVPGGLRPIWSEGVLHYTTDKEAVAWDSADGSRTARPIQGRLVAVDDGPVWTCGETLCGRNETGTWGRSYWPGHAISIGLESRIVRLDRETGGTLASGSFWDGLSGDGALGAWLETTPNGTRILAWDNGTVHTLPGQGDTPPTAPSIAGEWIVYARGANILAHRLDPPQTVVLATVPGGYAIYPVSASGGQVTFTLHPEHGDGNHFVGVVGLPSSSAR